MARTKRRFPAGETFHLFNRGNNRMPIFRDDTDRHCFVDILKSAFEQEGVDAHNFTLMTNHYHLVVSPRRELAVSNAMREVGKGYTGYFNQKYERCGSMWSGKFKDRAIADVEQALVCARYVEQNPVRARMVTDIDAYEWSSYRVYACGEPSDWLIPHSSYLALGATDDERQAAYRAICAEPLPPEMLIRCRRR
jgi:REP-associated tyrosine transposase